MKLKYIIFALSTLISLSVHGQKNKVESRPPAYDDPLDFPDFYKNKPPVESGNNAWVVFSDRANNPIYKKDKTSSDIVRYANFKEFFLVKSESAEWVEVAIYQTPTGRLKVKEALETIGWMPKTQLLLWQTALLDKETKIERKAFLLNQAEDVRRLLKTGIIKKRLDAGEDNIFQKKKAYNDPAGGEVLESINIYRFYFVYKKEGHPGSQRWLLAGDSYYPFPQAMHDGIVGWFSERDLQAWNTNLSMEPNFKEAAIQERTNNLNLRVRSFLDEDALMNISTTYPGDTSAVFVSDQSGSDVVGLALKDRSAINPNRHKGSVIRFPYLGDYVHGKIEFYKSGQIGNLPVGKLNSESNDQISEVTLANARSRYNNIKATLNRINVCIMVEATANTNAAKASILEALQSLNDNTNLSDFGKVVKYQAVLYRKPNLGDENEIKMSSETGKLSKAIEFVDNATFADDFGGRVNNSDNGVLLYQTIDKVMQKGIFKKGEANILIVLGCNGDVNTLRSPPDTEYIVNDDAIRDINLAIRDYRAFIHLFRVIKNTDQNGIEKGISKKFGMTASWFIKESGTLEFIEDQKLTSISSTLNDEKITIEEPELVKDMTVPYAFLKNGKEGYYYWPSDTKIKLQGQTIGNLINKTIDKSLYQTQLQVKSLQRILEQYKDIDVNAMSSQFNVSAAEVGYATSQAFIRLAEDGNFSDADLKKLSKDKLDLFTHVYLIKKPEGAKYNSLKFVVFMTHKRLASYQNTLKSRLLECQQPSATTGDKQKALENMQLKLFENLTGGTYVTGKDQEIINNRNVGSRIRKINQIVEDETSFDEKIDGIYDLKGGAVNKRIEEFEEILDQINAILNVKQSRQDLVLETADGQRYYWLTFDELF